MTLHVAGHSRVEMAGEWTLSAGDVLVVPAGQPHRMLEARNLEVWRVAVSGPGLEAFSDTVDLVRDGGAPVVTIPASRQEYLASLFGEAARLMAAPGRSREGVERSLLTLILAEVADASVEHTPRPGGPGGMVTDALRYIERHGLGPLALGEVAAAVGRSEAHLTTALKRATGYSVVQWIIRRRMVEARRLLRHSEERVDVIAERVGYADPTHFIRLFRREHGKTPAAWRRSGPS